MVSSARCHRAWQFRHDVPTARVETIPGAGHLANLDQPEAFADAVLRFTREVTDSAHGG